MTANADAARRLAAAILSERRFHTPSVPRPLHGLLHAIGHALGAVGRAVVHVVDRLGAHVPGGAVVVWIVLALALTGASALISTRYSRRLLLDGGEGAARPGADAERPAALERAAEAAEREGRLAEAVRLRFRAGLARLAERGAIQGPSSTPTSELARALRSPDFDGLAERFDEIVYGHASARPEDVDRARREWPLVVRGASRT